ncbi:hypothetical protein M413DRAFT_122450 [Hebeloma cylindrosporum]|uniref:DUF6533 domain-containing protein n=1 Tax=Hebeloma cylindrosporum TaxID=76867 RepID=A0A0C3CGJ9_HEBCY|nr:hypothetical protein M413DRAFT_122450 [Hebeloma cylindrosporum h7]
MAIGQFNDVCSLMSSSPELDALTNGARHLLASKYFQLAAFVMLVYDHMLTFDQEVNRIWRQKLSGASVLFLINRYITPLQFIIILVAFQDPNWTLQACDNYVLFEGVSSVTLVAVCELIMILRIYALYRRLPILIFLMTLWATQLTVSAIGLHTGYKIPLPPMLVGCILTSDSPIFPSLWVAPLITDACVFILTLSRTRQYIKDSGTAPTVYIFVRDGALYFLVIFLANLMNILVYFLSPVDLRALGASFSQMITSVMISRLVLNLRSLSTEYHSSPPGPNQGPNMRGGIPDQSFLTRTIGNLGEDMLFSGYTTTTTGDSEGSLEAEIPLANVSRRYFLGNTYSTTRV